MDLPSSIFPTEDEAGGVVIRDESGCKVPPNVNNAYCPAPGFQTTCDLTALPRDCDARILPDQINAIVSELLSLAEFWSPTGEWDCHAQDNLVRLFTKWAEAGGGWYNPAAYVKKAGDTMTGRLEFNDGTASRATPEGLVSFFSLPGQIPQLRLWCDLSTPPDGDYDADMASKSNMYLVCGSGVHLIPGKDFTNLAADPTPGRIVFRANSVANYIQSGGNYAETWFKDLILTRYNTAAPWMIFDESTAGNCGIGYLFQKATQIVNGIARDLYQVEKRLHVIDSEVQVALFQSTGASCRVGYRDQTTQLDPTIGSFGNEINFRTDDTGRMRIGSTGMYPSTDNAIPCGKTGQRWTAFWSANGTIQTCDIRTKNVEAIISADQALTMLDKVEPKFFYYKVGENVVEVVPDGTETIIKEEIVEILDKEGVATGEKKTIESKIEVPKTKEVITQREGMRRHAGFIAQDVKAAMDEIGIDFAAWGLEDKDNPESEQHIRNGEMVAVLWAAVRALSAEVKALKSK